MTSLEAAIGQLTGKWREAAELARAAAPADLVNMLTLAVTLDACADEADATVALTALSAVIVSRTRTAEAGAADGGFAASVRASAEAFAASVTGQGSGDDCAG